MTTRKVSTLPEGRAPARRARRPAPPGLLRCSPKGAWHLAPEGAAVQVEAKTAVIADVHLGYEWSRAAGGDVVPAHSLAETLAKLETLFRRAAIETLVVAGDLVESAAPCPRTSRDVWELHAWLDRRGVRLLPLRGNHDPSRIDLPDTLEIAGWTIAHGHRPIAGSKTMLGHHHPALRLEGLSAPCFLVDPARIILPAFSCNAAGLNVLTGSLNRLFPARSPRCLASSGPELLDFGRLDELVRKMIS